MKTIYSVSQLLMLLLGLTLTVTSCLRPDLSDCPRQNVRIVVRTHTEAARAESNPYTIENVTIYVFDRYDKFVTAWQGSAYVHGSTYVAELDIDPGIYHFVVWTNQGETYTATHSIDDCHEQAPSLNELALYLNRPQGNTITEDIPDLHHGRLTGAEVVDNTVNEFTVVLRPNTYKVNFTVRGLPVCEDEYGFTVTDNNSHYTFDNSIIAGKDDFVHRRTAGFGDDELAASMKVLRLASGRSPVFELANTTAGERLYSGNLVSMIEKAYSTGGQRVDFDTTFEFDILITFKAGVGVTVSINGWSYNENPTEL